ncbi:hypothetical protein ULMS_08840 [Patiriisocius marinistellae]|uniref:Immunity protein 63 domain-containing protein n=1 Tax=Patiriisocius marinistellae TaxID=2494560 RepID=A0A5J4FYY7_9FLAO|nr:hypothetical protein [Patiriisocius marinistellae]GEQ85376.1 hypothetical protein ULMS_08840 [Patiriisocius marinistellae]
MEYKIIDSPILIKESFAFLEKDYGFEIIEEDIDNSGVLFIYQNASGKVSLCFDYRNNEFNVTLIKGKYTAYPNDAEYWETVKPMESLIKKNDPNFNTQKLQPNGKEYIEAVRLNANLLQKYGNKVLKGQEWF